MESKLKAPEQGNAISFVDGKMVVPSEVIVPYLRGDGVGADITPVMLECVDAAVKKAYGTQKKICWFELYAGGRSLEVYGEGQYLPEETVENIKKYHVAIKGPMTTPVGEGIRSINVALRQGLDLYVCLRPVRYFKGVPSPVKHPELVNVTIFRENTEDIYAGIEWEAGSEGATKVIDFIENTMGVKKIRFDKDCGIGIKPVSKQGSERLLRAAFDYAIEHKQKSVTIVHKGNIMKFTEGGFKKWGYALAEREYGAVRDEKGVVSFENPLDHSRIIVKDVIADAFLQNILLYPQDYAVVAACNLNGDYISDAVAAQVGGIGIAPGANIGKEHAVFEATHGTAPTIAGKNIANPGSLILSACMMLEWLGWSEAAEALENALEQCISQGLATVDLMEKGKQDQALGTLEFGQAVVSALN